jgi:alkaline phosphatase D
MTDSRALFVRAWRRTLFTSLIVSISLLASRQSLIGQENDSETRVATPLPNAHAHNDYNHDRPLLDALDNGFCSIEADIYLVEGELYVAHDVIELSRKRKLTDLYLDPLLERVKKNGGRVYPDGPTITLMIDIKREGQKVYPVLRETLLKYREMLSGNQDGQYSDRAVQIIISGDRPKALIAADKDCLMGIDGRITDLNSDQTPDVLPWISDRWGSHFKWDGRGEFPVSERKKLAVFVQQAHQKGRKLRFWATPETQQLWSELLAANVDYINTDKLEMLREFLLSRNSDQQISTQLQKQNATTIQRIGMIGCHRQDQPSPAFSRYIQAQPDLAVWMGDNVYADTQDDIQYIDKCYRRMESQVAFQKLREQVPFVVTWDDHDYGLNNFDKNYKLKEQSKQLFRRFWQMEDYIPADRDGIYHARYFGEGEKQLQIILLDTRFNRDDEGEESDTLGENQWKWLEQELKKPARVRLIASGYQVLLERETKFETWSKFPAAQKRLFNLIKQTGAEGVIFLAGDQHYGEVTRIPNALGYDAIEFMSAGINQWEEHVYNSHRVSPVAHALNAYALIDIQWEKTDIDPPNIQFRCIDADTNVPELIYRVNFSELTNK